MYKVIHVTDSRVEDHQQSIQEALDQIDEGEIYSVQHAVARIPNAAKCFSTVIVYRVYEGS